MVPILKFYSILDDVAWRIAASFAKLPELVMAGHERLGIAAVQTDP